MINELQLVSLSDFIISIQCVFFGGMIIGNRSVKKSTPKLLGYFVLFAGLSAFMGGIDHGFFEPIEQRYYPRLLTYFFVAFATFFIFRYTILVFFSKPIARILLVLSFVQLGAFIISSFFSTNFLLVVSNYAPILLLFFVLNLIHINKNQSHLYFVIFCILLILASLIQVLEIDLSELINSDTFFHFVAFIAYFFLFQGIRKLEESSGSIN